MQRGGGGQPEAEGPCAEAGSGKTCRADARRRARARADALGVEEQKRACAMSWEEKCEQRQRYRRRGFEKVRTSPRSVRSRVRRAALEARAGQHERGARSCMRQAGRLWRRCSVCGA